MNVLIGITDNKDITLIQAFLVLKEKGINIDRIDYIRTDPNSEIKEEITNFYKIYNIGYDYVSLTNNGQLRTESDYTSLEEEIMHWYLDLLKKDVNIYAFIGGGNKFHSFALQKCTFLFGASEVFHMFVNTLRGDEPKTINEIHSCILNKTILYARLGKEPGWPALRYLLGNRDVEIDFLRAMTASIGQRSIKDVNEYPFECINILPPWAVKWLNDRISPDDYQWVAQLPKTELHCHLGGFATHGELLEEVRNNADSSDPIEPLITISIPDNWPLPLHNLPLEKYMSLGDNSGSHILYNKGCLIRQVELMYDHFLEQNIRYAEVRCSPYNYAKNGYDGPEVLKLIQATFNEKMESARNQNKPYCHVNLIIIATRTENNNQEKLDLHLQLAEGSEKSSHEAGECTVVGVDLAGFESPKTRPRYFEKNFEKIHKAGVALTIHAGENDDAEAIWDAVFKLNTRRIGHGLHLYQDSNLLKSIVNRGIGIEMCPYANYQIKGFKPMPYSKETYPLLDYLKVGAKVTVNTDNVGISQASLTDNFMLLAKMNPEITRLDILQLIRNGIEQSFIDRSFKNTLLRSFNEEIFDLIYHKLPSIK